MILEGYRVEWCPAGGEMWRIGSEPFRTLEEARRVASEAQSRLPDRRYRITGVHVIEELPRLEPRPL